MARPFPTNNAVTNAVAANTPIAFCMTVISCVEPDQTGPAILRPRALLGCPKPLRWGNRETTRAFSL
jgi:hypothetical protein